MTALVLPVADRLDLSGLVHRYASYVDGRRFDEVAELFTADGELILPEPPDHLEPHVHHNGGAGIIAAMGTLARITRTHHSIVGEVYTAFQTGQATGDAANGAITGVAHHWVESSGQITDHVWYLRYSDVYRRDAQGWRIAVRSLSIDAIETRPARKVRT